METELLKVPIFGQ